MSLFLAGIPLLGFLLSFTNSVGAALWAVDMEEDNLLDDYNNNNNSLELHVQPNEDI